MYYNARYYDPDLGRFLQADSYLDGMNRYSYCGNNPVIYNDPTGNCYKSSRDVTRHNGSSNCSTCNPPDTETDNNNVTQVHRDDDDDDDDDDENEGEDGYIVSTGNGSLSPNGAEETKDGGEYSYQNIIDKYNEMGKDGTEYVLEKYDCNDFVAELLTFLGLDLGKYVPGGGGKTTIYQIDLLEKDKKLKPNPKDGWNVFYKRHDDGTGHIGFVFFNKDRSHTIVHNGWAPPNKEKVNIYERGGHTDLNTFFRDIDQKHKIKYIPLRRP